MYNIFNRPINCDFFDWVLNFILILLPLLIIIAFFTWAERKVIAYQKKTELIVLSSSNSSITKKILNQKQLDINTIGFTIRNLYWLNLKTHYTSWDFEGPMDNIMYGRMFKWLFRTVNDTRGSTLKSWNYFRRGWPVSQFLYTNEFYNFKKPIGQVGHIVDHAWRVVRVQINNKVEINSICLSLVLELPVSVLTCIGSLYGGCGAHKKLVIVPIMRLSGITCINGIYGFNTIIPEVVYYIAHKTGKATSVEGAVGIKNQFYIDLSKVFSIESNSYNVYLRQCAFLNMDYCITKMPGRLRSRLAKTVNTHITRDKD